MNSKKIKALPRKNGEANVIILTEAGMEKITKQNDWIDEEYQNKSNSKNVSSTPLNNTSASNCSLKNKHQFGGRLKMCYSVSGNMSINKNNEEKIARDGHI